MPWRTPKSIIVTTPLLLRLVYALCLLVGASTHVWIVAHHGLLWDYGGAPLFSRVFWTSLTFLDPLAAILLFLKPRVGLAMTLAIIAADVAHNTWFNMYVGLAPRDFLNWISFPQVAFLIFVVVTFRSAWRGASQAPPVKQPHAVYIRWRGP
jgi:hypothetical protein